MWQIYSSLEHGVAVKSSVGRYRQALQCEPLLRSQFLFGKVQYHDELSLIPETRRDVNDGSIPMGPRFLSQILTLCLQKRSCYNYENEWRATLYQEPMPDELGVQIAFDLQQLITTVMSLQGLKTISLTSFLQ